MKKEMTLSEFEEFCKGRNEIRYIANWRDETARQFCELKMELEKIAVCAEAHAVRLSVGGSSVKFKCVEKVRYSEDFFGNIEIELFCRARDSMHPKKFYIFFPTSKKGS